MRARLTPGPWEMGPPERNDYGYTGHDIFAPKPEGEVWERLWVASVNGVHLGISPENIEANARLIAASPDLLKALEEAEAALDMSACGCADDFTCSRCKGRDIARAAIAKATGSES